jgi:hypothetical protein
MEAVESNHLVNDAVPCTDPLNSPHSSTSKKVGRGFLGPRPVKHHSFTFNVRATGKVDKATRARDVDLYLL